MHLFRFIAVGLALIVSLHAAEPVWLTDLDTAREQAAREHKQILLYFTGSTWCPPCIALHHEVLATPEFTEYAKNFVLVALDFPRLRDRTPEKITANPALKKRMELKERYGVAGYPTLLVLTSTGEDKGRVFGYEQGMGSQKFLAPLTAK